MKVAGLWGAWKWFPGLNLKKMEVVVNKEMSLQELDLEIGERAMCEAGYPHKGRIVVECIKDFNSPEIWSREWDDIVNNPWTYIKVIDGGQFGVLTSHFISSHWIKM